jgi:hypothetical protein
MSWYRTVQKGSALEYNSSWLKHVYFIRQFTSLLHSQPVVWRKTAWRSLLFHSAVSRGPCNLIQCNAFVSSSVHNTCLQCNSLTRYTYTVLRLLWSSDWYAAFISVSSWVPFLAQGIKYLRFIAVFLSRPLPCWDNSLLWQFVPWLSNSLLWQFVPWLRQLVTGMTLRRTEMDTGSLHARFVAHKVTLAHVFLPVLQFSPVTIIPPPLHIHSSTTGAVYLSNWTRL